MKRFGNSLFALLFLYAAIPLVAVAPALAEGNYISGGLGIAAYPDSDLTVPGVGTVELSSDAGFMFGIALGTKINGFRLEGEVASRINDGDKLSGPGGSVSISGDTTATSLMVNGYYDFSSSGSVAPFLGAGIGFANIAIDYPYLADDDDVVFAYQLIAGIGFTVNPKLTFDLSYKFLGTSTPSFSDVVGDEFDLDYSSHAIQVGLRYAF